MLRVDLVERLARHAHESRAGKQEQPLDSALATSLGLQPQSVVRLMKEIGFRQASADAEWKWKGRSHRRPEARTAPANAFAALAGLRRG